MNTRTFITTLMALTLGLAAFHAYGWTCNPSAHAAVHESNGHDTSPSGFPCGTFNCDDEYHWIVKWSSGNSCSNNILLNHGGWYDVGSNWWGDNRTASLSKSGYFGGACLASNFCPRCEDSTSACVAYEFQAYCCF